MLPSSAVLTGAVPNLITAQCRDDTLSLSVNAVSLVSVQDGEFSGHYIGLLAAAAEGGGMEALFDNSAVYAP